MNKNLVIILCVIVMIALLLPSGGKERSISGIPAPVQEQASGGETLAIKGYEVKLSFLYSYDIEALVVHKKNYTANNFQDKLAPVDLALAWGTVAQYNKEIDLNWSQSGRFAHWQVDSVEKLTPMGGMRGVQIQASNNHLIPADKYVAQKIKKIKTGDHIRIKGYLVNVQATKPDGQRFYWNSSTTREDTGGGACEVIYVKDIQKIS